MARATTGSAEIKAREQLLLTAVFDRDQATMAGLMSPDGYGFDASMGLVSQGELIAGIGALAEDAGFALDQVRVVDAGPGAAALTYRLRQWGRFSGVPLPATVYCSSVWRLEGGRWKAFFHHETEAGDSEENTQCAEPA